MINICPLQEAGGGGTKPKSVQGMPVLRARPDPTLCYCCCLVRWCHSHCRNWNMPLASSSSIPFAAVAAVAVFCPLQVMMGPRRHGDVTIGRSGTISAATAPHTGSEGDTGGWQTGRSNPSTRVVPLGVSPMEASHYLAQHLWWWWW